MTSPQFRGEICGPCTFIQTRLNRGVLLTPFHNIALMSPATTESDVDAHTKIFASAAHKLVG
jgi:glutamate-1-semialdehyde aminotransferase